MFHRTKSFKTLFTVSVSLAIPLVLAGCEHAKADDPRIAVPLVRIATAGAAGLSDRTFTGVVVARVQSDLGFRVAGKVVERLVNQGQSVKRGQPLMRIDPTDLTLATLARTGSVAAARAKAAQTQADEKRLSDLVSAGAVSASAYDQAKAAADSAKAMLGAELAQENVARNEAGYSVLVADADGVVMETLGEPGQVVTAGQTVVRLARSGPREAAVSLPETVRPPVGSFGRTQVFGSSDIDGLAKLRQLSSTANPLTRTFEARYVLEGAAAEAPLGSTVTVRVVQENETPTMRVPLTAIYDQSNGPGVWVVAGEPLQVKWRAVQVASLSSETATLSRGLNPGEKYVTLGAHMLHEGTPVRIAAAEGAKK